MPSNIAGQIAIMDAVPSVPNMAPDFLDLYSRGAKAIIYVTDTRKLLISSSVSWICIEDLIRSLKKRNSLII
jgi:hypothetical protein